MEKEQIVKALEWCSELRLCVDCPMRTEGYFTHSGNACRQALMQNALSLIREQEKRIEELEAENEKLKNPRYMVYSDGRIEMIPSVECVRNETVRKMQDELKKTFSALCKGEMGDLYRIIDQIAKEILEGAE